MNYREDIEKREYEILDARAAKAAESRGRQMAEAPCRYRTDFSGTGIESFIPKRSGDWCTRHRFFWRRREITIERG